jgi:hypothetical protein
VLPARADKCFAELWLGDSRAQVSELMGRPRRTKGADELNRYRSCQIEEGTRATEVLVFMKGIDRLFIVGLRDDRVVAKCSVAM